MELTSQEQEMLCGNQGVAVADAMRLQIEIGKFWGAKRFVQVTNVHMMGDIEVIGDGGLAYLQETAAKGARARCSVTTNARCADFRYAERLGQDPEQIGKESQVIRFLKDMDVSTVDTCINYQTVYQPHLGEHVAWGDTGTVIYANSVFGARTNFEGGPSALAAAITGRTPEYGFHLDSYRKGNIEIVLDFAPQDLAEWGAIGKLVGEPNQSYSAVPVFTGVQRAPMSDELKHLGASLASYGSMGMFHMVGVTPEARSREDAFGGSEPRSSMTIGREDVEKVFGSYDAKGSPQNLVVFSAPQMSPFEMKLLAGLFRGRRVHAGTQVFVTTSHGVRSQVEPLGYLQALEEAGVIVLEGVCFYILQNLPRMRATNGWSNIVTNSAKLANIIGAHKFNAILRRTAECVDIACEGR